MKFKSDCEETICEETKKSTSHLMSDQSDHCDQKSIDIVSNGEKNNKKWNIKVSNFALKSINPIRQIVESLKVKPNPCKSFIPLSIGDPNFFGNLMPHEIMKNELNRIMNQGKNWGYFPSSGLDEARKAIAQYISVPNATVTSNDIYLASGGSHALDLCISLFASPGVNILIPRPGFPLYQTLALAHGIECKFYDLNPDDNWKVDINHLQNQIDSNTVAIVYNNPSNPCGAVYSIEHIIEILNVAADACIPIIADEIYEAMVFDSINTPFVPIASLTSQVPVLSCRGLTKR